MVYWPADLEIFLTAIPLAPETVEKVVLASCSLHNFFTYKSSSRMHTPAGSVDVENIETGAIRPGDWRVEQNRIMTPLGLQGTNTYT